MLTRAGPEIGVASTKAFTTQLTALAMLVVALARHNGSDAERERSLVTRMIELLTAHTYIENEVMYPRVRELLPEVEDDVLESYEEHHVADVLVMELSGMSASDERFTAKTTVLIENVTHHIQEEEDDWFPKVREGLGRKALQEIGAEMLVAVVYGMVPWHFAAFALTLVALPAMGVALGIHPRLRSDPGRLL